MNKLLKNKKIGEILRFGIVGALATTLQFVLYYFLTGFFHHNISLPVSYVISLFFNFLMSSYYTFKVKPNPKKGLGFLTSHVINLTLQFLFLNFFIMIGIQKQWAIIPVFVICIPVNFILVRLAMKRL